MADVRLVDLEVIKRYSLAVRRDLVPADELLEALDASVAVVRAAMGTERRGATRSAGAAPAKAARAKKATPAKAAKATKASPVAKSPRTRSGGG